MHRTLTSKGNPPRRPFKGGEADTLIDICATKIKETGDVWGRNQTILAFEITTGLRIKDVLLPLKYENLNWDQKPLRLKIWLCDGKIDRFSSGKWSITYVENENRPNDGIRTLWNFTKDYSGPKNVFIFQPMGNPGNHISYDACNESNTPRVSKKGGTTRSPQGRMAFLSEDKGRFRIRADRVVIGGPTCFRSHSQF